MTITESQFQELESLCKLRGVEDLEGTPTQTAILLSIAEQIYHGLPSRKKPSEKMATVACRMANITRTAKQYVAGERTDFLRLIDGRPHRSEPIISKIYNFKRTYKRPLPVKDILDFHIPSLISRTPAKSNAPNAYKNLLCENSFENGVRVLEGN